LENQENVREYNHYSFDKMYDSLERFISYYHQLRSICHLKVNSILEIGIGNRTVSNYLLEHGYDIKTLDLDEKLKPDFIGDIRKIPIEKDTFDAVLAAEVIEHIPWNDVSGALLEIHRITKKYAIISTPYSSGSIEVIFASQIFSKFLKRPYINFCIRIPKFWHKHKYDGQLISHCWEMGRKGFSKSAVRKLLSEHFNIIEESMSCLSVDLNHYFFVLEKK
jgi:hypothetical protein